MMQDNDMPPFDSAEPGSGPDRSVALAPSAVSKSALVDQAYQEYVQRCEQGEQLDADEYCAQFPAIKNSLVRLFDAHFFLQENSVLLAVPDEKDIPWPKVGAAFAGFQLLAELGQGAFARVYLAAEPAVGNRLVAVKVSARFGGAEADILGKISHPHIVPVHSNRFDRTTRLTAVCMPYVGSATLCDVLDKIKETPPAQARVLLDVAGNLAHPLDSSAPPPSASVLLKTGAYVDGIRLLGAQLADALVYLHARGICHQDLKPSNVLLTPDGVPMLLDFNLSVDPHGLQVRQGGTLPYMSPEQLRANEAPGQLGATAISPRSDLFSLGVILYQLVTGKHPFGPIPLKVPTTELSRLLLERQRQGSIDARRMNPAVDPSLSRLIQRCLAFDPEQRPHDAAAIVAALRQGMTPWARARRWLSQRPKQVLATAFLVLVLALAGIAAGAMRSPLSERQYAAGIEAYEQGRFAEAKEHFNQAVQADPQSARTYFARARAHIQLGATDPNSWRFASEDYQRSEELAPHGKNWAGMGYCALRTGGRRDFALEYFKKAIENGFVTAEVYNNVGLCQFSSGDKKAARISFDEAIKLDPNLATARANRALMCLEDAKNSYSDLQVPKLSLENQKIARAELTKALAVGMDDILQALVLGGANAESSFHAACFYCVADPPPQNWKADALRHLRQAVNLGYSPARLKDRTLDPLRAEPAFKALAAMPIPAEPMPGVARYVDPIKD